MFSVKENSIHFIHFLSVTGSITPVPQNYPFFVENGCKVSVNQNVYQKNEVGSELSAHAWIEKDWLFFFIKITSYKMKRKYVITFRQNAVLKH